MFPFYMTLIVFEIGVSIVSSPFSSDVLLLVGSRERNFMDGYS